MTLFGWFFRKSSKSDDPGGGNSNNSGGGPVGRANSSSAASSNRATAGAATSSTASTAPQQHSSGTRHGAAANGTAAPTTAGAGAAAAHEGPSLDSFDSPPNGVEGAFADDGSGGGVDHSFIDYKLSGLGGGEGHEDTAIEAAALLSHVQAKLRERVNGVLQQKAAEFTSSRELTISVATFNVGEKIPRSSPHYARWLQGLRDDAAAAGEGAGGDGFVDIVAVGLQEVDMSAGSVVLEEFPAKARVWEGFIASQLEQLSDYCKVSSVCMSGLLLLVYARERVASRCINISSAVVRIGERGLANKGAVGVRLTICGRRLLFLNTHLEAHTERLQKRNRGYDRIVSELHFPLPPHADEPLDFIFNTDLVLQEHQLKGGRGSMGHDDPSRTPADAGSGSAGGGGGGGGGGAASSSPPDDPTNLSFLDNVGLHSYIMSLLPAPVAVLKSDDIQQSIERDYRCAAADASKDGSGGGLGVGGGGGGGGGSARGGDTSNEGGDLLSEEGSEELDLICGGGTSMRPLKPSDSSGLGLGVGELVDDGGDEGGSEEDTVYFVHNFDYVFWFGDLNYRLWNIDNKRVRGMLGAGGELSELLKYDQLSQTLATRTAFGGFEESAITFAPTYKYDPGTLRFDTSAKQRAPSWTDRVLYLSRPRASFPPAPQHSSPSGSLSTSQTQTSQSVPIAHSSSTLAGGASPTQHADPAGSQIPLCSYTGYTGANNLSLPPGAGSRSHSNNPIGSFYSCQDPSSFYAGPSFAGLSSQQGQTRSGLGPYSSGAGGPGGAGESASHPRHGASRESSPILSQIPVVSSVGLTKEQITAQRRLAGGSFGASPVLREDGLFGHAPHGCASNDSFDGRYADEASAISANTPHASSTSPSGKYGGALGAAGGPSSRLRREVPLHVNSLRPDSASYGSHHVLLSDHLPVSARFTFKCVDMNPVLASRELLSDQTILQLERKAREVSGVIEELRKSAGFRFRRSTHSSLGDLGDST
eukprot:Rhum_TRINITY_DN14795_c13_g1::Rhum_TRINITY_DN14795_c13_g1_i1::g.118337::m.118337